MLQESRSLVRFFCAGFPYFHEKSKTSSEAFKQKYHLLGAIVHGIGMWVFTMSHRFQADSNATIEVLQRLLKEIEQKNPGKRLPKKLYVQMDNCVRENKNKYVLGYLSWLVQRRVFDEIQLSFLPVGHTHEDIDQMFSRIAIQLRTHNAVDLEELKTVVTNAIVKFNVRPEFRSIHSVANLKDWLTPYLNDIHGHAGREILHFQLLPSPDGAMIKTKARCDLEWGSYATDSGGFHLLRPETPLSFTAGGVRNVPPPNPLKVQDAVYLAQIKKGLMSLEDDPRLPVVSRARLYDSLSLLRDTTPSVFDWQDDGLFRCESEELVDFSLSVAAAANADAMHASIDADQRRIMGAEDEDHAEDEDCQQFGTLMTREEQAAKTKRQKQLREADTSIVLLDVDNIIVFTAPPSTKSARKKDSRRFHLGRVLHVDRTTGNIEFQWLTPYTAGGSRKNRKRKLSHDLDGYLPDYDERNLAAGSNRNWTEVVFCFRAMDRDAMGQCYRIPPELHATLGDLFGTLEEPLRPTVVRALADSVLTGPIGTPKETEADRSKVNVDEEIAWTDRLQESGDEHEPGDSSRFSQTRPIARSNPKARSKKSKGAHRGADAMDESSNQWNCIKCGIVNAAELVSCGGGAASGCTAMRPSNL
jgi:hypothetical protein